MRRLHLSLIALCAIMPVACTDSSSDRLDLAESEFEAGRYESAQSLTDELVNGQNTDTVSVGRLCRLSLLSAKLAEHNDEESNLATATRCMQSATKRDSDSVAAFIETLTIEDRTRTALVSQLMRAADHPADSILIEADEHE